MSNQPIEEKWNWQEEFEKRFRYFFHQPCERCSIAIDGETMRDRIIWTDSLKKEVVSFIENLLEQERKRMIEEIEGLHKRSAEFEDFSSATVDEVLAIINK